MNKKLVSALILIAIVVVGGIGVLLLTQDSDSDDTLPTVGILSPDDESAVNFIKQPMGELGYVEGETIHYIVKVVADPTEYDAAAQFLIDQHVDVIYTVEVSGVLAASKLTTAIPIVFYVNKEQFDTDILPIRERQGIKTNLTGFAASNPAGKRFDLLMKIAPTIEQVYFPYNPDLSTSMETLALVEDVAATYGVTLAKFEFTDDAGAQQALETIPEGIDAIFLGDEVPMMIRLLAFANASLTYQVPLASSVTQFGTIGEFPPGLLLGYGGSIQDTYRQVAELIDHILQGTAPADLVIRTSSIYCTLSLGAAEALGIEIPDEVLRQADQVLRESVVRPAGQDTQASTSGAGACSATLKTPAGESDLCVEVNCDLLQESGFATFANKVEVESCPTENAMGVCVTSTGNAYYYNGVTATIQSNCISRGGEWTGSVE